MSFGYKDPRWIRKRKVILKRDEYRCRECRRYGKTSAAEPVHHIYPVETYPKYAWCDWNLISLCKGCHGGMHDRVTNQLTAKGITLMERVSPPGSEF